MKSTLRLFLEIILKYRVANIDQVQMCQTELYHFVYYLAKSPLCVMLTSKQLAMYKEIVNDNLPNYSKDLVVERVNNGITIITIQPNAYIWLKEYMSKIGMHNLDKYFTAKTIKQACTLYFTGEENITYYSEKPTYLYPNYSEIRF